MKIEEMSLPGVVKIHPRVFLDERGFFYESFSSPLWEEFGIPSVYAQDNHSFSYQGVLRGMHFQRGQAKLIHVIAGCIYDVFVDICPESATFGKWQGVMLDSIDNQLLLIPDGYAHGFYVMSDQAHVVYKVSDVYNPLKEQAFRYDDPHIGIEWPKGNKTVSERDLNAPFFSEVIR
jgi:dTDP-4-dehydrorhamnose 3,5-epimerase